MSLQIYINENEERNIKWFDQHYAPESILADEIGETEDSKNRASSRVGQ